MMARRILIPLLIAGASALVIGCGHNNDGSKTTTIKHHKRVIKKTTKPKVQTYVSLITGEPVKHPGGQYFATTIENSPDARPQTGLANADIVYEMEAEGTITRYLAFFHDDIPASIGPMRSARPYFITTAEDWGAPFIHFGGSPEAYAMLKAYPYAQIDGITEGKYFTRDSSRQAPHNAYLQTVTLSPFHTPIQNGHFKFGTPALAGAKSYNTISVNYNSFTQVKYVYSPTTGEYMRFQDGAPDDDRGSGKQIYATNVIIQYAQMNPLTNDPKGRITINLNGPGLALYFTMGKEIAGTWTRTQSGRVVYYNSQGQIITLHPGKTWIEVVDDTVPVSKAEVSS